MKVIPFWLSLTVDFIGHVNIGCSGVREKNCSLTYYRGYNMSLGHFTISRFTWPQQKVLLFSLESKTISLFTTRQHPIDHLSPFRLWTNPNRKQPFSYIIQACPRADVASVTNTTLFLLPLILSPQIQHLQNTNGLSLFRIFASSNTCFAEVIRS